jgi:hypothetical protein
MNVWQGRFPVSNRRADGYLGAAPVRECPPNGFGFRVAQNRHADDTIRPTEPNRYTGDAK